MTRHTLSADDKKCFECPVLEDCDENSAQCPRDGSPGGAYHASYPYTTREMDKQIRVEYAAGGVTHHVLGEKYGLSHSTVADIINYARMRDREPIPQSSLTEDELDECIRGEYAIGDTSYRKLGRKYGMSRKKVTDIVKRLRKKDEAL